jgi:hypothetical protein
MTISYAITVCNELEEISRLLDLLLSSKRPIDEIVVLMDTTKASDELVSTLRHYEMHNMNHLTVWAAEFQGHFADWKNKLTSYCTGDYVFQIDADEYPHSNFIADIPAILEGNPDVDLYLVPRVNTVEGLTQEHIQKWGWRVDGNEWVNWPDWQHRIYRNDGNIEWKNKVHEILVNYKQFTYLPTAEEYALYHPKTIDRQERQNNYYDTL